MSRIILKGLGITATAASVMYAELQLYDKVIELEKEVMNARQKVCDVNDTDLKQKVNQIKLVTSSGNPADTQIPRIIKSFFLIPITPIVVHYFIIHKRDLHILKEVRKERALRYVETQLSERQRRRQS